MESILTSIKKLLGIAEEYTVFDNDIIIHINSVFMVLSQMGVGPTEGFKIEDKDDLWSDFIRGDQIEAVKSYVHLKVKLLFDPPLSSVVMECHNRTISELEFRLSISNNTTESDGEEEKQNG